MRFLYGICGGGFSSYIGLEEEVEHRQRGGRVSWTGRGWESVEPVCADPFLALDSRPLKVASSVMQTEAKEGREKQSRQERSGTYGRTKSYKHNVDYNCGRAREGRRSSAQ